MSTKLYDGLKLNVESFADLHSKIVTLRDSFHNKIEEDLRKICKSEATRVGKSEKLINIRYISDHNREHGIDLEYGGYGRGFHLKLYVYYDNGNFYGYPVSDRVTYEQYVTDLPWVEDCGYWNNTDKPDDLTEEEWEEREELWNRLVPGANLADTAMIFNIHPSFLPLLNFE